MLRKHRRQDYRCGCGHIETALGPEKSVDGGRYSLDFGVHVAVSKWDDHLRWSAKSSVCGALA
ncbi:MAG: hypothetical protein AAGD10_12110 [Myxococcota bacterium]